MLDRFVRCDNPKCKSIGEAEWLPPKGSRKKRYTGPYGWIQTTIYWVGRGPNLEIDACSLECLTPATQDKLDAYLHNERYGEHG